VKLLAVATDATGSNQVARTFLRTIDERVDEFEPDVRDQVKAFASLMAKDHVTRIMTVPDSLHQACAVVRLLGPPSVEEPAQTLWRTTLDDFLAKPDAGKGRIIDAEQAFIHAAQRGWVHDVEPHGGKGSPPIIPA
jgi:hypothetical protein